MWGFRIDLHCCARRISLVVAGDGLHWIVNNIAVNSRVQASLAYSVVLH